MRLVVLSISNVLATFALRTTRNYLHNEICVEFADPRSRNTLADNIVETAL